MANETTTETMNEPRGNVTPLRDAEPGVHRVPPHNFEAEMALLGAILANNRAYEQVSEFLRPEHFADPNHARIYEAASRLIEAGQIADAITLRNFFEQDGALAEIGGPEYLARLAGSVVTFINAADYGRTIHDRYLRRQLIALAEDVANRAYAYEHDMEAPIQIELAEQNLFELATSGDIESGFKPFSAALRDALKMAETAYQRDSHVTGVPSGFVEIDKKLGGLHPAELIILAGRPSMGKTALATNIAFNAARSRRPKKLRQKDEEAAENETIGFFSLEMSAEELATRILAEVSGVPSHNIRRGEIGKDAFPKFVQASQTLSGLGFFIDDTPALTVTALRTRARRLKRQHDLSLIVVDYLQLMRPSLGVRPENRVQEISEITRGLKAIAKELEVPVLALSQLSRQVEHREDKRPLLSDLRESGAIEQDADVVMFIYREEYYLANQRPPDGTDKLAEWIERMDRVHNIAEVNVAKQRHGPVGNLKLYFNPALTKFQDLADDDRLPDEHP